MQVCSQNDIITKWWELLDHLELAGLEGSAVFVLKLENINAAVEIFEIQVNAGGSIFNFIDFFAHEIEDQ